MTTARQVDRELHLAARIAGLQMQVHRLKVERNDMGVVIRAMLLCSPNQSIAVTNESLRMAINNELEVIQEERLRDNTAVYYVRECRKDPSPPAGESQHLLGMEAVGESSTASDDEAAKCP